MEEMNPELKKSGSALKAALLSVLALLLVAAISLSVLYMTNKDVKRSLDKAALKFGLVKDRKKPEPVDYRVRELADHYMSLSPAEASDKLLAIKKEDKKLYPKIISAMLAENAARANKITEKVREKEAKADVLQREYEEMSGMKAQQRKEDASHYSSLGIKGAIVAIEGKMNSTMDFEEMAGVFEEMKPDLAARILYYMNSTYGDEIRKNLGTERRELLDKEKDKYAEFIRKNSSLSAVYNRMEPKMAAAELENKKRFNSDQLGLMFSKMDYLSAARILREFESPGYISEILEKVKDYEDYESVLVDSVSEVISDSLKILQKYDEDVDILKRAYEKLSPADLADIIDRSTEKTQVYKEYQIDENRNFRISEKDMTVEVLKRSKPAVVSALFSELKNSDRLDKASYLSREIGIPQP